jgi:hypothetical protein
VFGVRIGNVVEGVCELFEGVGGHCLFRLSHMFRDPYNEALLEDNKRYFGIDKKKRYYCLGILTCLIF